MYRKNDLFDLITRLLNSTLYFNNLNWNSREQGSEILFSSIPDSNNQFKTHFMYYGRTRAQYTAPATDAVNSTGYNYVVLNNLGRLKKTDPTSTTFNNGNFLMTNNFFCRGSGQIEMVDQSDWSTDPANGYGALIGLVKFEDKANPDLFSVIQYGMFIANPGNTIEVEGGGNAIPGRYYIKTHKNNEWVLAPDHPYDKPTYKVTLGKIDQNDLYGLRFFVEDNLMGSILNPDYEYDKYALVLATLVNDNTAQLIDIRWTESLISVSSDSSNIFYSNYNPEHLNLVPYTDINKISYDDGLGFSPANGYSITLNLYNNETVDFWGYVGTTIISPNIKDTSYIYDFAAKISMDPFYDIPPDIFVKLNLPLESYNNNRLDPVLYVVPMDVNSEALNRDEQYIKFSPPHITPISLKNINPMYLDHLTVRLEDENNKLIGEGESCKVVVVISHY